jgi:hypothetical protein
MWAAAELLRIEGTVTNSRCGAVEAHAGMFESRELKIQPVHSWNARGRRVGALDALGIAAGDGLNESLSRIISCNSLSTCQLLKMCAALKRARCADKPRISVFKNDDCRLGC